MHAYDDGHHLLYEDDALPVLSTRSSLGGTTALTRTVAIIKTHALNYRFEIERRIEEASFEVCVQL